MLFCIELLYNNKHNNNNTNNRNNNATLKETLRQGWLTKPCETC